MPVRVLPREFYDKTDSSHSAINGGGVTRRHARERAKRTHFVVANSRRSHDLAQHAWVSRHAQVILQMPRLRRGGEKRILSPGSSPQHRNIAAAIISGPSDHHHRSHEASFALNELNRTRDASWRWIIAVMPRHWASPGARWCSPCVPHTRHFGPGFGNSPDWFQLISADLGFELRERYRGSSGKQKRV